MSVSILSQAAQSRFRSAHRRPLLFAAALWLGALPGAGAATVTKADNNADLSTGASWLEGTPPGASDLALLDNTLTANRSATTSANLSWLGLRVTTQTAAQLFTIGSTPNTTLTLGASGLDLADTSLNLAIAEAVVLGATQVWNTSSNTSAGLTVSGVISGAGFGLTKTGNGVLTLNAANTFTGGFTLGQGAVNLLNPGALGAGTLRLNGGELRNGSGADITLATNNAQVWNGDFTFSGPNGLNLGTGAVTLTGARNVVVTAASLTVGGAISGAGFSVTKLGAGALILAGNNQFNGGLFLQDGTLGLAHPGALGTGTLALTGGALANSSGADLTLANNNPIFVLADVTYAGPHGLNLGTGPISLFLSAPLVSVAANSTLTLGGTINGSGSTLNKAGNGTLVLSGNNSVSGYSGGTMLSSGTLVFANANSLPPASGGAISVQGGGNATLGFGFAVNQATLNRIAPNAVDFTLALGANTSSALNFGNFSLGSLGALADRNVNFSGALTPYLGTYRLGGGGGTLNLTANNALSGAASDLVVAGSGLVVLSGANSYGGGTAIENGALQFQTLASLGTGAVGINGGVLRYGAGNNADLSTRALTFGPAGATLDTNSNNVAFANSIGNGGPGGFTKSGAGNLTLNSAASYGGATFVNGGRLVLGAAEILPDATDLTVLNGATFDIGANNETVAHVTLGNGSIVGPGTLTAQDYAVHHGSIAANLAGPGGLTKTEADGTVALTGVNTYAGPTALNAGTVEFTALANLGANDTVSFNGGTLRWAPGSTADVSSRNLVFNAGGATLDTNGSEVVLANAIGGNGAGALTKTGAGNLTLAVPVAYTGATIISQGALILGAFDVLAGSPVTLNAAGAGLNFGNLTHATLGGLSGNAGLTLVNNSAQGVALTINAGNTTNLTYSGDLAGAGGSLLKTGGGQLTLNGTNTYDAGTTISSGTLVFGTAASVAGTGRSVSVASGATVSSGFGIDNGFLNRLVENSNAFTVALAGNSGNNLDFGGSAGANLPNASLGATGNATYTGTLTPSGGHYRLGGGGGILTLPNTNAVTGAGGLTVVGDGVVVLSGANDYAGGTFLNGGSLRFSSLANLGGGALSFDGGALQWAANSTTDISTRAISFGPGGGRFDTNGNNVTLAGAFGSDSAGSLEKLGGGTLTLNGNNTYAGGTTISSGTVSFTTLANLGGGGIALNGGTLNWLGTADISTRLVTALGGNSTLNIASGTVTLANSIGNGGAGRIIKAGAGALTLNAASTNTGGFTLASGTLNLGNSGALGSGTFILEGGTLANPTGNMTTDALSAVQLNGNFTYTGLASSTLTLRAANFTATGTRTITAATAGTTLVIEGNYTSSGGLTKTGPGIVSFNNSNVTLASGLELPSIGGTLQFVGSNLTVVGNSVTNNGTTLILRDTNATFGPGTNPLRISANADNGTVRLEAGSNLHVLGSVEVGRSQTAQPNYNFGFVVNGGNASIDNDLVVGYRNSGAASTLNSGSLIVNGRLVVGNNGTTDTARPSGFRVQNGTLLIKGPDGLVINSGVGTAQVLITGGNTTTERIAFGPGGAATSVTSNLAVNGGNVFVGSGGIALVGSNITPLINLNGGALAAKADWSSSLNATIGAANARFVTADADGVARNITWDGVLSGNGSVVKSGNGVLSLGGNNTYAGNTSVTGGVLAAAILGNGGTPSSIGQSGSAATSLVLNGALLRYTGAGDTSTNRQFTLEVNGGGFESSGNGNLTFVNTTSGVLAGTDTARTFQLGGTNAGNNTFGPAIVDNGTGATSLRKTGPGKWILAGENTYTGPTTIEGGALHFTSGLPNSAVTIQAGGTVTGVGPFGGAMTVNSGGGLFAGDAGVGNTTVAALTVNTGAIVSFGLGANGSTVAVTNPDGLTLQALQGGNGGFNLYTAGTTNPWTSLGTFDLFTFSGNLGGDGVSGLDYTTILNPFSGLDYHFSLFNGNTIRLTVIVATQPNAWNVDANGNWSVTSNWGTGTASGGPNGAGVAISLPGLITAPRTVTLNANRTVGSVDITSTVSYTLAASGGSVLTLNNSGAPAVISLLAGTHTVSAPLALTAAGVNLLPSAGTTLALSGNISGAAGAVTLAGDGTLVLSGTSSYGGGTNFNAGQVEFATLGNLGSGALNFNGGALRWAPGSTTDISNRTVNFLGGDAILDTNGNNVTLTKPVGNNGPGGLTKIGNGVLTLGGTNTYQGATNINGGVVRFTTLENLGAGSTITFNGGTLLWGTGGVADISERAVVFNAGGATFDVGANNVALLNPIGGNGSGGLTKRGAGDLTLFGDNTYGGSTFVQEGRLSIASDRSLGAVPAAFTPNSLILADHTTLTTSGFGVTLSGNRGVVLGPDSGSGSVTVDVPEFAQLTIPGVIANNGAGDAQLVKNGSGDLMLGGNNTFTGGVVLNAGILLTTATGALGTGPLLFNGGQWDASSSGASPGAIILAANSTITNTGSMDRIIGGNLTASANKVLTLNNFGQLTLAGSLDNFTGTVQLTNGPLRFNSTNANTNTGNPNATFDFGNSGSLNSRNAGTIHLGAVVSTSPTTTLSGPSGGNGTATFSIGGANLTSTFAGDIVNFNGTAIAALAKVGNAALTLTGNNTYTGGTTISTGTLNIGDGGATGTIGGGAGNVTVLDTGTLNFNRSNTYTVANNINGGGGVNHLGSGELVLTGNNAYTGATTVSGGGILTVNTLAPGGVQLNSTTTAPVSLASATTGPFARPSGTSTGNATVALGAGNTTALFVGQTVTGAGIPANTTIAAIDDVTGTITLSANATATAVSANLTYGGNPRVTVSDAAGLLAGQIVTGTGVAANARIVAVDAGNNTVTLSSAATANTTANNLNYLYPMVTVSGTAGLAVGQTVAGPGVPLNATIASIDAGNNTVFLNVGATASGTGGLNYLARNPLGGSTAEASNLVIANGTFRYAGTAAGSTDRLFSIGTDATLEASGVSATATASFTNPGAIALLGANAARTFTLSGSNTGNNTLASVLGDNGTGATTLHKAGNGTWVLPTANTYTGGTLIQGGLLRVTNPSGSATGAGPVTVAGGATLSGTGILAGVVTAQANSTVIPGNDAVGNLTFGGLNIATGAAFHYEFAADGTNDLIAVTNANGLVTSPLTGGTGGGFALYQAGSTAPFAIYGTYNLFSITGAIGGSGIGAFTNASILHPQYGVSYSFDTAGGFVRLIIAAGNTPNVWNANADGNWGALANWNPNTPAVPDGVGALAYFGSVITGNRTVTLDGGRTVGNISFDNVHSYTIAPGTGALTLDNGASAAIASVLVGHHTIATPVVLTANGVAATIPANTSLEISGEVGGPGGVAKTGQGPLTLSSVNTYAGATTVDGGVLRAAVLADGGAGSSVGRSSNAAGNLVLNGGALAHVGAADSSTDRLATIGTAGGGFHSGGSGNVSFTNPGSLVLAGTDQPRTVEFGGDGSGAGTFAPLITDNGAGATSVAKTGSSTWNLTANHTYTGSTVVTGGVLGVSFIGAGGVPSGIGASTADASNLVFNGGKIHFNGPAAVTDRLFTLGSAGGGLAVAGGGSVNWTNNGTLAFLTPDASSTLALGGDGDVTFSPIIPNNGAGNVSVVKEGSGVLTLLGANTYAGGTTVESGTLLLGSATSLGTGALTFQSGTLRALAAAVTLPNAIALGTTNVTFPVAAGNTTTLNGTISGAGGFTKTGDGTLVLGGGNSFAGGIVLQGGTVNLNSATAAGNGGTVVLDGATVIASVTGVLPNNPLIVQGAGTIVKGAAGNFNIGGTGVDISGDGILTINTGNLTGLFTIASGMTNFTGTVILNSPGTGIIRLNSGSANVNTGSANAVWDLDASGEIQPRNPSTVNLGALLGGAGANLGAPQTAGGNNTALWSVGALGLDTTYAGTLSVTGSGLIKVGNGTLTLSHLANPYSVATTVSGGVLAVTGSIANSPVTVNTGGRLAPIATVVGNTTYGIVGQVTVNAGGVLGGNGTAGAVTVNGGGRVAPGASSGAIATLNAASLTWNSDDLLPGLSWTLSDLDHTSDLLHLTGNLIKGAGTVFLFDFQGTGYFAGSPTTYTLVDFAANSGFVASDFGYVNAGPGGGYQGFFTVNGQNLQFTLNAIPEPGAWAALLGGATLLLAAVRRRRRANRK